MCGVNIGQGLYQFVATAHQAGAGSADPYVLLLTSRDWAKQKVMARYRLRWCTESLFRHLKSNGFDLEELGFSNPQKIRLLVAIVVVLYIICVAEGLKHVDRISQKTYAQGRVSGSASVFRVGYGVVSGQVRTIAHFLAWLLNAIRQKVKVTKPAI